MIKVRLCPRGRCPSTKKWKLSRLWVNNATSNVASSASLKRPRCQPACVDTAAGRISAGVVPIKMMISWRLRTRQNPPETVFISDRYALLNFRQFFYCRVKCCLLISPSFPDVSSGKSGQVEGKNELNPDGIFPTIDRETVSSRQWQFEWRQDCKSLKRGASWGCYCVDVNET
jgi:hypothetical protein